MALRDVTVVGHILEAPELRYLEDGLAACFFSIDIKRKNSKNLRTLDCVSYEKMALSIAQRAKAGMKIAVVGKLRVRVGLKTIELVASSATLTNNEDQNMTFFNRFPPQRVLSEEFDAVSDEIFF